MSPEQVTGLSTSLPTTGYKKILILSVPSAGNKFFLNLLNEIKLLKVSHNYTK